MLIEINPLGLIEIGCLLRWTRKSSSTTTRFSVILNSSPAPRTRKPGRRNRSRPVRTPLCPSRRRHRLPRQRSRAGMAMADLIRDCGGRPADFLDLGGGVSEAAVRTGFGILLADPRSGPSASTFSAASSAANSSPGAGRGGRGCRIPDTVRRAFRGYQCRRGTGCSGRIRASFRNRRYDGRSRGESGRRRPPGGVQVRSCSTPIPGSSSRDSPERRRRSMPAG